MPIYPFASGQLGFVAGDLDLVVVMSSDRTLGEEGTVGRERVALLEQRILPVIQP